MQTPEPLQLTDTRKREALLNELQTHCPDITDVYAKHKGQQTAPKNIHNFALTPLIPRTAGELYSTAEPEPLFIDESNGLIYREDAVQDGKIGLGLTYRKQVSAICAGYLTLRGPLINQIQDISPDRPNKFANGLRSGIDWKRTLVGGWCRWMQICLPGIVPPAPISIQSATNNDETVIKDNLDRFQKTYDEVALSFGASACSATGNFVLPPEFSIPEADPDFLENYFYNT